MAARLAPARRALSRALRRPLSQAARGGGGGRPISKTQEEGLRGVVRDTSLTATEDARAFVSSGHARLERMVDAHLVSQRRATKSLLRIEMAAFQADLSSLRREYRQMLDRAAQERRLRAAHERIRVREAAGAQEARVRDFVATEDTKLAEMRANSEASKVDTLKFNVSTLVTSLSVALLAARFFLIG